MLIDTGFDVRGDAGGKDPDTWSPTLRHYHQALWSKPLPGGVQFTLEPTSRPPYYFHHASPAGQFILSSDAFVPTYTRYGVPRSIIETLPDAEHEYFNTIAYTIGGLILWPSNRVDGKWTINQARGCLRGTIGDRMDLTLECIRRYYLAELSPMTEVLGRYSGFFDAFVDFRGYVDFWLLQDLVSDDYSTIRFFTQFDNFVSHAIPRSLNSYVDYRCRSIEFIEARNARIAAQQPEDHDGAPSEAPAVRGSQRICRH